MQNNRSRFLVFVLFGLAAVLLGNCQKTAVKVPEALRPDASHPSRGLVFRVTQGEHTLYLAGSIHMLTALDYPLPSGYDKAFAAAAKVVFEIEPAEMKPDRIQSAIQNYGGLPSGNLENFLTAEAYHSLKNWSTTTGQDLDQFSQMAGWRTATTIATLASRSVGMETARGLDSYFQEQAHTAGKATQGFETVVDQFRVFASLSPATQSAMVSQALKEYGQVVPDLAALLKAWRSGDLAALEARTKQSFQPCPELEKAILDQRNAQWWPKIQEMLASPPVEMILVGSAHLAGPAGLVARFRGLPGCTVEAL